MVTGLPARRDLCDDKLRQATLVDFRGSSLSDPGSIPGISTHVRSAVPADRIFYPLTNMSTTDIICPWQTYTQSTLASAAFFISSSPSSMESVMATAYEHAARYRNLYAKLLRFYPKQYRERFGEGMEQTFNDLCRERAGAKQGLLGFALWTFADTLIGIIKEGIQFMTPTFKKNGTIIMSLIAAITMLATAYLAPEYENAWLYILVIWSFLFAAFEVYDNYKKNKDKDQ